MNKIVKRVLAVLLATVILFGCLAASAAANENHDNKPVLAADPEMVRAAIRENDHGKTAAVQCAEPGDAAASAATDPSPMESVAMASAAASGDFEYTVMTNGVAMVLGYTGPGGAVVVPDTLGGYPVGLIGYRAFFNCASVESIVLPESVTFIADRAFENCVNLRSINIPDVVTTIWAFAFQNCEKLQSIVLPSGINEISEHLFHGCTGLESIVIPDGVSSIASGAFLDCTSLTAITLPESVTEIKWGAFANCESLLEFVIPSGVSYIGASTFSGCKSLRAIEIHDGIQWLGSRVFQGCESLTTATIPDSITWLLGGEELFKDCTGLEEVFINCTYKDIRFDFPSMFAGCSSLKSVTLAEDYPRYVSVDGVVFNKNKTTLNFFPAGRTGAYTVPAGVEYIANSAFSGSAGLTSVTFPESLDEIGRYAFEECISLRSVTIPDNVEGIGALAFYFCVALESVTLGKSVETVDYGAFAGCFSLSSFNMPLCSPTFGEYAVLGDVSLTSFTVGAANPGYSAPDGLLCDKAVTKVVLCPPGKSGRIAIPAGVTAIVKFAFDHCVGITSIQFPDSVGQFGDSAFRGCESLTYFNYPRSLTVLYGGIFNKPFEGCPITAFHYPENASGRFTLNDLGCTGVRGICSDSLNKTMEAQVRSRFGKTLVICDGVNHGVKCDSKYISLRGSATSYPKTFWNMVLLIFFFGWIWMAN